MLGVEKSATGRRWVPREFDDRTAQALAQRLGLPEALGRVLAARGVGLDDAEDYLEPTLRTALPDPSDFHDMDVAADRLVAAIQSAETIAIFGDYDVDGATSAALLSRLFSSVGGVVRTYIPDRITEGYGPNGPAMVQLAKDGAQVVVTVDCGVSAFEALDAAADAGLDVIVVDHHAAEAKLPRALGVINPNRLDETGEFGALAAVGVAFLLAVAVNRALRLAGWYGTDRPEPDLMNWLDLVALGTVCDVVPLVGLNRALVIQGLKVMAGRRNVGIKALADVAGMSEAPGAYHAGFVLGPRVNAGGRVGRSDLGTRLLATDDPVEAGKLAAELDKHNAERKAIEAGVLEAAQAMVGEEDPGPVVIVAGRDWHPGVIGIVAARLKEQWRRPAIVIALNDGVGKGSARSVRGVDMGAAVIAARQAGLLDNGGGHPMAAGLTVAEDQLEALRTFLADHIGPQVAQIDSAHDLTLDGVVTSGAANMEFLTNLERAGPFGSGNPEPRFAITSAQIVRPSIVGHGHVRMILGGGRGSGASGLTAIAFRAADGPLGELLLSSRGVPVHVAGNLRANHWQGTTKPQLIVHDGALAVAGAGDE
ncbi:MAG: single-stranded-DNA-specific exonuclease RecJ [Alphaproteobacteria bacterium]|jgi:single-stranded-DNA-specific exonuclease|nr:single-stranded-DNA-specific exonuclease RecJ [Alphaproteobacteria bacterium]MBT5859593.1 single-stranded-DNA-specific exonuclease RecJ [Alphaproteobacteria bacterium]